MKEWPGILAALVVKGPSHQIFPRLKPEERAVQMFGKVMGELGVKLAKLPPPCCVSHKNKGMQPGILAKLARKHKCRYTRVMEPNTTPTPEIIPAPATFSSHERSRIPHIALITLIIFISAASTVGALRLFLPFTRHSLGEGGPASPVENAEQPAVVRQSLASSHESLAYYVAASQEYLKQARAL